MEKATPNNDQWVRIVRLHAHLKALLLLAEENEIEDWQFFLQPLLEQRYALDHIVRAIGATLGEVNDCPPDYSNKNLDKAVGHLYRAFFDTADWLTIILRGKVLDLMKPYSTECITEVCPRYYKELRPRLEELSGEYAQLHGANKDISASDSAWMEQVETYRRNIEGLLGEYRSLHARVPSMDDFRRKLFWSWRNPWLVAVVAAVVGAVLGAILVAVLR